MQPTHFLICREGKNLMPVSTEGVTTEDGLIEVVSPQGTVYTANPAHLVSEEEGATMLRIRRAEQLAAEGYDARLRADGSYRMFQPKKHGQYGGYFLTIDTDGIAHCNCPSAQKAGSANCKHALGIFGLLRIIAANRAALRREQQQTGVFQVKKPGPRLAAMIEHDGWGD